MVSRNFFRFNTTNIISAETDNEDILDEAVEWCDRYELLFSRVDPASELFRLNSAEGRPTACLLYTSGPRRCEPSCPADRRRRP